MRVFAKIANILGVAPSTAAVCAEDIPNKPRLDLIHTIMETALIDLPEHASEDSKFVKTPVDVISAWAKANNQNVGEKLSDFQKKIDESPLWKAENNFPLDKFTERMLLKDLLYRSIGESPEIYLGRTAPPEISTAA